MLELVTRIEFWVAMAFAVVVKLRASPTITRGAALTTTVSAVTGSLIFTGPVIGYLGLDAETMGFAVAALVALTCEHFARLLMNATPADLLGFWKGKP